MRISELSGKVDQLISVATNIKNASSSPAAPAQADDPEVQALADRIDQAIAVLTGASIPSSASTAVDPNAPVT